MRRKTVWVDENTWACLKHIPRVRLPAELERCWYSNCSERPPKKCSLEGCFKEQASNSKYCSTSCKNKYARKRYNEKIKKKQEAS